MRVVPSKTGMLGIKEGALDFTIFILILTGVVGAGARFYPRLDLEKKSLPQQKKRRYPKSSP